MRSVRSSRFFVEDAVVPGATVEIAGGDAHKIARVLRLRKGDSIALIDSAGRTYSATLLDCGRIVRAEVQSEIGRPERAPASRVHLAQAVPKGNRMDFVIEKATELGVATFQPFFSERSVGRNAGDAKLSRWQRLARTAAQQCGRSEVPHVEQPVAFDDLVQRFSGFDTVLFAWELAEPEPLMQRLAEILPSAGSTLVVVGPEGGFSHAEAEKAAAEGAKMLWLGPRVLRTDTAALVLLAVIGAISS
jgi:16S rRNA (uracil1498-N3)-methyltransferase